MKIGMIGHKRIPGREGGIETVVEELSIKLVNSGHDVTVYNRSKKGIKKIKKYKGINVITIPTIERKNTDAIVYSFFASICALFKKYDVLHYHGIGPSVMIFLPHLFKKKIIVTVHGLNYKTPKWKGIGSKVMKFGEKMVAKYADEIIVLSRNQQDYFLKKYNRKTNYIPNGVSISDILKPNSIENKWGLSKDKYILFLSRIVPGKGVEYLIDAFQMLDTNLKLVIAGGTEYVTDFYREICTKVAKDNRIKMVGFVSGNILNELYSNARLFVFPSEAEGMPVCLLEALSFNTPCLVSDIPENKEVGKEYVNYFKSKDINDLKMQMEKQLKKKYEKNSRDYVKTNYSWDNITKSTIELYEKVKK